jgi:hypothetical protein
MAKPCQLWTLISGCFTEAIVRLGASLKSLDSNVIASPALREMFFIQFTPSTQI